MSPHAVFENQIAGIIDNYRIRYLKFFDKAAHFWQRVIDVDPQQSQISFMRLVGLYEVRKLLTANASVNRPVINYYPFAT